MTQLLIVDDSASFRAGARLLLEPEGCAIAEAATGSEGVRAARELRPDLVLLDVQLPDADGFEVAARLAGFEQPPPVILISTRDRADYGGLVETSPVRGFIPKHELSASAIQELLASEVT